MDIQTQVVQDLAGLLAATVTAGVAYLSVKAKAWLHAHTNAQVAATGNSVVDGLSKIVDSVVQDFNSTVVNDAKLNGTWTAAMGAQVKQDAIAAVKSQASNLLALGQSALGNVDSLIGSMIEQFVANHKLVAQTVTSTQKAEPAPSPTPAATTPSA